ncbi:hypothetical protein PQC36_gp103 [Proteus phage Vb_PmiP-P59]|uniref:Uncharacterized protein n=3 Tax=Privateervirus TaxID=2843440 RepID=A0A7L7SN22_9CAUD|nr:hypothetical protein HWD17_gp088 [Proteus phage Privateer]YP_010672230.1 hypothetical protein PQC36_gp103 [Proteus phage Vb_PmiP-P59]YP_010672347.1 hypothetical protein PQC37_gp084 [Proteus phage 3H10_20]QIN94881.1 hypothetical protein CPT_Privateer_088 [Proteus phage Privateer]QMV48273.1 hypothetical protein [Proteus phage Vb_PmiP-P59]QOC54870.1 hypothetical protein [Proteus phage 3H10_20]
MEEMKEAKVLRLDKPVVVRKMPMTDHGSDLLRAVRDYQVKVYKEKKGEDVIIPFPVSIYMMLNEYCHMKGIKP